MTLVLWNRGDPPSRRLTEGKACRLPVARFLFPRCLQRWCRISCSRRDQNRVAHYVNEHWAARFSRDRRSLPLSLVSYHDRHFAVLDATPPFRRSPCRVAPRRVTPRRAGSSGQGARLHARRELRGSGTDASFQRERASDWKLGRLDESAREPPPALSLPSFAFARTSVLIGVSRAPCAPQPPHASRLY